MAPKKKVRKRKRIGRALFRLALLLAAFSLAIFGLVKLGGWVSGWLSGNSQNLTLFFYDDVIGTLVPVERQVSMNGDLPSAIVEEILKGPTPLDHAQRTVAEGTTLNSLEVSDGVAIVNLSSKAQTPVPPCTEEDSLYSIVNSLCMVPEIRSVRFKIDALSPSKYWEVVGLDQQFTKQETTIPPTQLASIYFPERRNRFVALELVTVRTTDSVQELARLVMRRYIQGPRNQMLRGPLPHQLSLPKITFSSGLLTVNFDPKGLELATDAAGELIFAQSLIWTLTDIRNVAKARILVDGKPISLGGHISWKDDFTRLDSRLVDSPAETLGEMALVFMAADFGDGFYAPVPRIRLLSGPSFDREPLDRLFDGTDPTERELGLITCAPADTRLLGVKFAPDLITIDASSEIAKTVNQSAESTFARQIILTATDAFDNRNIPVTITIDGETRSEPLPYGTPTTRRTRQQ